MQNNIGDARREYADRNGKFTQEDAAAYFGVSLSTYKKWEQGQGMLNGTQLRAIASKYGVTVDYLLRMNERRTASGFNQVSKPSYLPTSGEQRLLDLYRSMNAEGRERLMEQAAFLAERHPLNQADSIGA